jgi:hypothetical protein
MSAKAWPRVAGAVFFLLYLSCGLAFHSAAPRALRDLDQLFDADVPSRIVDLTRYEGPHDRTQFHPLYVLLLNPPGQALRALLRIADVDYAGRVAAVLLNAAAGGLSVALFALLLLRLEIPVPRAAAWTLSFALSSSQLVFGSLPESWAFSVASLLLLFVLGARPEPPRDGLIGAGVLAFGMLVTNLGAALLVRRRWRPERPGAALKSLVLYALAVLAVTAAFNAVQLYVYPGTTHYIPTQPLARDDRMSFVWPAGAGDVVVRLRELAAHFLFFNLAAPELLLADMGGPDKVVDFPYATLQAWRPLGVVHALAWIALLAIGAHAAWRSRLLRDPIARALLGWIAANAALHLVFGTSLFLYSCQWTFAVLALAALGLQRAEALGRRLDAALAALVLVQAANNALFLRDLFQALR